jgi:hypothetical protein
MDGRGVIFRLKFHSHSPMGGDFPCLWNANHLRDRADGRLMGYEQGTVPVHGFRSTASTLLNEQGKNRDWIERQLAHGERDVAGSFTARYSVGCYGMPMLVEGKFLFPCRALMCRILMLTPANRAEMTKISGHVCHRDIPCP